MKETRTQIASVVRAAVDGKQPVDDAALARDIAAYLLETGRTGQLDSLMRDVMQARADAGTVEVVARSATPLSDQVRQDIIQTIKTTLPDTTSVIISPVIDPEVIAGIRLELANQQLDLSVRATLNRFKQLAGATS